MVSAARKPIQSYKFGYDAYVLRIDARDLVILAKAVILVFFFLNLTPGAVTLLGRK